MFTEELATIATEKIQERTLRALASSAGSQAIWANATAAHIFGEMIAERLEESGIDIGDILTDDRTELETLGQMVADDLDIHL